MAICKIKSSESFRKQPTQLIIVAHNCHIGRIGTHLVEGGLKWNKVDKSGGLRERLELPGGGSYSSNNGISEAEIENLFRIETVLICLYPHHIIVQLKASSEKKPRYHRIF